MSSVLGIFFLIIWQWGWKEEEGEKEEEGVKLTIVTTCM